MSARPKNGMHGSERASHGRNVRLAQCTFRLVPPSLRTRNARLEKSISDVEVSFIGAYFKNFDLTRENENKLTCCAQRNIIRCA
eukprot:3002472-Pleurochrysis_carterae.AAC.3